MLAVDAQHPLQMNCGFESKVLLSERDRHRTDRVTVRVGLTLSPAITTRAFVTQVPSLAMLRL